jgi:hypothetical protein
MKVAAPCNPNICAACAQLLEDESPERAARVDQENALLAESVLAEPLSLFLIN